MGKLSVAVAKTLYHNLYRCRLEREDGTIAGIIQVMPGLPLPPEEMPENAPKVPPFLLVIVEDADITEKTLIDFEDQASAALLKRFATENVLPHHCQFFYTSPAFVFEEKPQRPAN